MLERPGQFLGRTYVVLDKQLWVALFERGFGADDLQRCLPTPATPRVCDAVVAVSMKLLVVLREQPPEHGC